MLESVVVLICVAVAGFMAGAIAVMNDKKLLTDAKSKKSAPRHLLEKYVNKDGYKLMHVPCGQGSNIVILFECHPRSGNKAIGLFCNYCGIEQVAKGGGTIDIGKKKDPRNLFDLIREIESNAPAGDADNPAALRDDIAELKKRLEEKQNLLIELETKEEMKALLPNSPND